MVIIVVKRGAKISRRGSTLLISKPVKKSENDEGYVYEVEQVPLIDIEMLVIVGSNVRISSGAILMLAEANIPIIVHSKYTDAALVNPFNIRIAEVRRRLYNIVNNAGWRVHIGRLFIEGKLLGLINIARYIAYKDSEKGKDTRWVLEEVSNIEKQRKREADSIANIDSLRMYEAKWSKKLWELLVTFVPSEYGFTGRNPKGKDPINSAISYAYAIIYGLCTHALIASGLDPYAGIIHIERAGRTSLTYDFSEMFKPVAIHQVIMTSRVTELKIDKNGYLTVKSLKVITRNIHKALKKKHRNWKYTLRGEIYSKAWELRQNIEKGTKFIPFIYHIK